MPLTISNLQLLKLPIHYSLSVTNTILMNKKPLKLTVIITVILLIFSQYSDFVTEKNEHTASTELLTVINNIKTTNPKSQKHIRIMSYNLLADSLGFEGTDAHIRADGVCNLLNELSPDVIGLQETSRNWHTCIQKKTDYSFISPVRTELFGTMTSVIYNENTLTLLKSGEKVFNYGYDSRLRRMVWGIFKHNENSKIFAVINTHFSLSNNNITTPMNQASELLEFGEKLREEYNCPVFFIGDFNARERNRNTNISSSVYETLCTTLNDAKTEAQSVASGVNQSIYASSNDHIFIKGNAEIKKYVILSQNEFANLSDHYPIFVDIVI